MYIDKQALYESFLSRGFDDACARLMAGLDQAILEEEKPKLEKKLDDIARKSNIDSQDVTKKINNVKQNIARLYENLKDVVEKYRNGENDQPEDANVEQGSESAGGKNQNEGNDSNAGGTTISEAIIEFDDDADKDAKTGANTEQKKEENNETTKKKNNNQQSQQDQQNGPDQSTQNDSNKQNEDDGTGKNNSTDIKNADNEAEKNGDSGVKKYEITGGKKELGNTGRTLHQIRALREFGTVKKGDVGGWIEHEENLSHEGNCWVSGNARVFGKATVKGDALVYGNAEVSQNAEVSGSAQVYDTAIVHGSVKVLGKANVHGNADVSGNGQFESEVSRGHIVTKTQDSKDTNNVKDANGGDADRPKKVARTKKFPPLNYKTEDGKVLGDIVKDIRANTLELLQLAIQRARMENNRRWKERESVLRDQKATAEAIEEERGNFSELSHRDIYKFIFGEDGHGIRLDVFRIDEFKNIE